MTIVVVKAKVLELESVLVSVRVNVKDVILVE